MSVRTIFLLVRGSYQAGMAMRMARQDLRKLGDAQREIVKRTEDMMRAANQWVFAGGAFLTFGAMVTKAMTQLLEKSAAGQRVMANFGIRTQRSLARLSEAIAPILGQVLDLVAGFLELITAHPILLQLTAGFLALIGPVLIVGGAIGVLYGSVGLLRAAYKLLTKAGLEVASTQALLPPTMDFTGVSAMKASVGVNTLTVSMAGLFRVVTTGLFYFTMVYTVAKMIENIFGSLAGVVVGLIAAIAPLVALLWGAAAAMSVLTWGTAALAGAAAIGTIVASIPSYQSGTSFVRQGGMAMLHGGEEIISARESRVTSLVEKGRQQRGASNQPSRSTTTVNVSISTVNTKSNFDDVQEKIGIAIKEALDNKV